MAIRGRRPTPAHLRLIDGTRNATRHGTEEAVRKAAEKSPKASFGKLNRPEHFKGHALAAWELYIKPATWLDRAREPCAIAFCELWQEFSLDPTSFRAAKHTQLRAYASELGLTDERKRVMNVREKKDEHFDD
jgi:hypothetical protein